MKKYLISLKWTGYHQNNNLYTTRFYKEKTTINTGLAMQNGKEEGKEEGKYETALAIARKMKEEKFDIDKIAGFTELSIEKIESL